MTPTAPSPAPDDVRERAVADYLAVSRNADLYASPADYASAEQRAWERLQEVLGLAEAA